MKSYYKEPVIVFGVIAPLFAILVALGIGIHFKGKFESAYKQRRSQYVQYKKVQAEREALERRIREQEPHLNRWMGFFEKATASSVNGFLSEVQKDYDSQELQQTAFRRTTSSGGIGGASKQPSVQIQLAFRGTYRALQNTFLELESRMPHLQLDSIRLTVHPSNQVLDADVNYTAWQKE